MTQPQVLSKPVWATNIKKVRKELDMSQTELGELFAVTPTAVSYWEHGHYEPPVEVLAWLLTQMGQAEAARVLQ